MPLLLCLGFGLSLFGQPGIQFETGDWETILQKAESEGKLIFVDVYTDWCGPCIKMSREVFPQKEVGDYYNANFVNVKIDAEKGEGPALAQKFGAIGYPTLLFVSADEEVLQKVVGGFNTEMFMALGRDALRPEMRLPNLKKQFDEGNRDLAFLKSYLALANMAHEPGRQAVAEAYLAVEQDWASEFNLKLIYNGMEHADSPLFNFVNEHIDFYNQQFDEHDVFFQLRERILAIADPEVIQYKDEEEVMAKAEELIQLAYPTSVDLMLMRFKVRYYLKTEQNEQCLETAEVYLKQYRDINRPMMDEHRIFADYFIHNSEAPLLLQRAIRWVKKSDRQSRSSYNKLLLAQAYYRLGNKKKAIWYINQAERRNRYAANQNYLKKLRAKINAL